MKQAWDKNVFENGQCKPLGTADSAPSFERLQSTGPGEKFDEKALPVAGGLSGAGGNLPLTPAGLRLARLQAQLTLQRLRLAHGGHAAVAVLDRVLLDAAAMAQPPSDRLGGSGAPRAPGAAFPPAPVTFPPPGTPAGGAFPGNLAGIGTNRYGGGNASRIANPPGDRDRFGTGGTDGGTPAGEGGRYGGPEIDGRTRFYSSDSQIRDSERWIDPNGYTHRLPPTPVPTSGLSAWAPSTPGFVGPLAEPYDPEEPTADRQGIVRWPQKGEEGATLQAHQLDDYRGVTPSRLPHRCSICEKKVYNPKDWDRHVKGKSHAQNRSLYTDGPALGALRFPVVSGGCRGPAPNDDAAAGRDVSTGGSSFLQAAPMTSFPLSGAGFALHGPGTKFVVRNQCPGRVVHICNLPEGSCTENDVINLGLPFGQVTNYILMRSTHQAFLEMAYVEAAQAMVQYYQLRPATVDEQKLLIRMSKRYKELQLKKPGKDVESIIQDINFRREREEPHVSERYPPDRARSRSPVVRSVTPPSHSPGFTSCSSAHSPRRGSRDREERRNGEGQRGRERRFSSRRPADEFYEKEPAPRRRTNEAGFERRDGSGDRRRSRRSESELPEHGRRGRTSRTHEREDRAANRHRESTEHRGKERSSSPRAGKPTETSEGQRDRESEADGCGSGEDAEGDRWYPKSMEELVTVDEVGEEDDSVVEPDLPELREEERPEEDGKEERDDAKKEERDDAKKEERDDAKKEEPVPAEEATSDAATSDAATGETLSRTEASPARVSLLTDGELKRAPAEPAESPTRVSGAVETRATATHVGPDSVGATRTGSERARTGEVDKTEMRDVEEHPRKEPGRQTLPPEGSPPRRIGVEAPSPSREQERTVGEHGIPLGVEFIVPSAGFYCKLCGLFYASEETAKTAHCRSAVHYRNLQKYLSRLAEESPLLFRSDAE